MGKFIPVEPEKWGEMVQASAENPRLKALTAEMDKTINASQAECRRLKAEVERLKSEPEHLIFLLNESYLKNERLTKAGDALENWIAWECESPVGTAERFRDAWNAAKEGKAK